MLEKDLTEKLHLEKKAWEIEEEAEFAVWDDFYDGVISWNELQRRIGDFDYEEDEV